MDTTDYCEHPSVITRNQSNVCQRCGANVHTPRADEHPPTRSGMRAMWVPILDRPMPEWRRRSLEGRNRFDAVSDMTDRVAGR